MPITGNPQNRSASGLIGLPRSPIRAQSQHGAEKVSARGSTKHPSTYVPRPRSADIEGRVGQIMIAWGALERELSMSFALIYRMRFMLGMCISANMGTMAKIDALRSAVNMYRPLIAARLVETAVKELNAIAKLTGDVRTPIAHGQPWHFSGECAAETCSESENDAHWHWIKFQSRSTHTAWMHFYGEADFNEIIGEIDRVTLAWHRSSRAIGRALGRFSDRKLEKHLRWD